MKDLIPSGNNGLSRTSSIENLLNAALERPVKEKPYTAQITSSAPTAFIFLIDQSGSMHEDLQWKGLSSTKADVATCVINEILEQLMDRSVSGNLTKEYYSVAVIGYGGDESDEPSFCWENNLKGKSWVSIQEMRANRDVEYEEAILTRTKNDSEEVVTKRRKGWIAKKSGFKTPMKKALLIALDLLKEWIAYKGTQDNFPPTVINITDGEATDADSVELIRISNQIKDLRTTDGNVLFFNVNISDSSELSVIFPSSKSDLPPDEYAQTLFNMSSSMPNAFKREIANTKTIDMKKEYIAMAYNAGATELVQFMNIGTSQTKR
jgi:hypothetical protein